MIARLRDSGFDVLARNHAEAILTQDFPAEAQELGTALADIEIPLQELIASGGGEAASTQRLRRRLAAAGWAKHCFKISLVIDGVTRDATTHEIDHVRRAPAGTLALEIEWNNKDPFFDRDLENFQRLHAQSVISLGIILTRGASLHDSIERMVAGYIEREGISSAAELEHPGMKKRTERQSRTLDARLGRGSSFPAVFARTFVADKYGEATTHWRKLEGRVARGVGNPCPLMLIGLPASVIRG